jgi:hypothetical protein
MNLSINMSLRSYTPWWHRDYWTRLDWTVMDMAWGCARKELIMINRPPHEGLTVGSIFMERGTRLIVTDTNLLG